MTQFEVTSQLQDFLNATFMTVIVFLGILSSMLVYSLMLSDVDGKTYEYGMLRALGFKKPYLVSMISISSFSFSVPGMVAGILVAYIINIALRQAIFLESKNSMGYDLSISAYALGFSFGILMPFWANYVPIKSALDQNLRTSLDLNQRSDDKIGVKVTRLESIGISPTQFLGSAFLVGVGFTTFYFIPRAFMGGNMTVTFVLLNLILVMIIVGLTFLCALFFSSLERLLLWLVLHTCCRRDKKMYYVVCKNMEAHSKRNTKTSIMFTMAITFLIFSASSFNLMSTVIAKLGE